MKRQAIIIGNTGGLQGVQIDIEKTTNFLMSGQGGGWYQSEIAIFEDPRRASLLARLEAFRRSSIDLAFVLFSGHGGHKRRTTLNLNADGEEVEDSTLLNIANRQISIFDCCRVVLQDFVKAGVAMDSFTESLSTSAARLRYESRVMQAIPQQVKLYSCEVGQYSHDTPKGAMYLGHLLDAARSVGPAAEFKAAESAHADARTKTILDTHGSNPEHKQTPEAYLPKCLISQQLIISQRA
jgi:Caspase domain